MRTAALALAFAFPVSAPLRLAAAETSSCSAAAVADLPSAYYGIEMVPTKRVPGTAEGTGLGKVNFAASPYGVAVSPKGEYVYEISLGLAKIKPPKSGTLTAWVTKSDLSEIELLGVLDDNLEVEGSVSWNKFLLVVTLEPDAQPAGDAWRGPIVMRGMSRSGMMHTLAGHGPFEKEPCSKYGFK